VIALATVMLAATFAADPCLPDVETSPAKPVDREAAALYRAVGDEARAAGDLASARVAYHEALRNDPTAAAHEKLREVCRAPAAVIAPTPAPASDRFSEGVAIMKAGDREGAIAVFERARATGEDPAAALLEGVCQFELGRAERARPLFEIAARDPAVAPTASFFLGMLALREGESDRATALLAEAATGDPRLAANASTLSVLARRGGHLVLSALTEIGYDSNVELIPDGTAVPGSSADGSTLVAAGLTARMFGASGPYARLGGQYREQFVITAYDLGQVGGALGGRLVHRASELSAEYGYDFVTLGDAAYLSAHRVLAIGRVSIGETTMAASYAARLESFLPATTEPYSGLRQGADARVSRRLGRVTTLGVGYRGERDNSRHDPDLSYLEHGPLVLAQLQAASLARFMLEGRFSWRVYDTLDPDLGVRRADRYLDGYAVAEIDLGRFWTVRLAVAGRRALSNVPEFRYTKLATTVGLVYTLGIL
jgi:tetratricopeptide (TPR) repeat protein